MSTNSVWQGYSKADIYSAQDDCLISIADGKPLPVKLLQRIPPHRASLLVQIAKKAGVGLERGTHEQLIAEAGDIKVAGNGKLGRLVDEVMARVEHEIYECKICGKCKYCIDCICPREKTTEEKLRDDLSALREVQAGWAFGVPEDGRDQWLDAVASVMKKYT